jgi:CRP-like cAMP-binding protein
MQSVDVVSFLRSTELLSDVSDSGLETIAAQLEEREVAADTVLFEEGTIGQRAFLILDGSVALVAAGIELVRREAGGVVGEFALIDDQPRSATGVTLTPARLLVWSRSAFIDSLMRDPDVGRGILRVLTRKLRDDVKQAVVLGTEREQWMRDLARARDTQARMLPAEQVTIAGLDVAGHCAPVGALGGDFYDVLDLGDGRAGLIITDVTGNGFYASLFVAMTKSALYAQADHDPSPAAMMKVLRRTLALSREWTIMMSCAYILFEPKARKLCFANAGHPYPLHRRARDGTITALETLDVVLGVQEVKEVQYSTQECSWEPGDLLVLYSDGITEARAASGEMYGQKRLERSLTSLGGDSVTDMRDELLSEVHTHLEASEVEDDVTLVVAKAV